MKKFILMFTILIMGSIAIFAEDVVVPADWQDLYNNYGTFFATYLGIAGIATFLAEALIRLMKTVKTWYKVVMVCVISIAVSFVGNYVLNVGFLAEASWWETLLWGGLAAATASGLRSTNLLFVKSIVDFFIGWMLSKEPEE